MYRPPADLMPINKKDEDNSEIYIAANLAYMFYLTEDPVSLAQYLHQELPRIMDGRLATSTVSLWILQQGFSCVDIDNFDTSRLLIEGIDYLREFYQAIGFWSPEIEAFQHRYLPAQQQTTLEFEEQAARFAWTKVTRPPILEDIFSLVDDEYVVEVTFSYLREQRTRPVLVHGYDNQGVYLYETRAGGPTRFGDTNFPMSHQAFSDHWNGLCVTGWKKD